MAVSMTRPGGGFARYATDDKWLVPHFEKMLYDNALLIKVWRSIPAYESKIVYGKPLHETMEFIEREMIRRKAVFISALTPIAKEWKENFISGVKRK